jgi:erythromycin esterase
VVESIRRAAAFAAALSCVGFVLTSLGSQRWQSSELLEAATQKDADNSALVAWARQNLHEVSLTSDKPQWSDLEALRRMIGDATLVSFGEGLHLVAEPLEFRNRLFRFLVEQMGFTAIVIESGFTESYVVNEYVLGGPGDLKDVTARGITFGFGGLPQQAALVRWMREYNSDPKHVRKIQFYGMDVSRPGRPEAPLDGALAYLDRVDPAASRSLRDRIRPMLPMLKIDRSKGGAGDYSQLAQAQRDAATAVIADMIVLFEINEGAYVAATSARAYELAYRSAIAARHADESLRQVPVGWSAKDGSESIRGTVGVADRTKMDNIRWIREQQGPGGRVMVFAHVGHLTTTGVTLGQPGVPLPPMVGTYLKRRYGAELVTIGHFFGLDASSCQEKREPAPPQSLEGLLTTLNKPAFVLDLRKAPPAVARRLQPLHGLYGQRPLHSFSVGEGIDVILFTERVTRAIPCQ